MPSRSPLLLWSATLSSATRAKPGTCGATWARGGGEAARAIDEKRLEKTAAMRERSDGGSGGCDGGGLDGRFAVAVLPVALSTLGKADDAVAVAEVAVVAVMVADAVAAAAAAAAGTGAASAASAGTGASDAGGGT